MAVFSTGPAQLGQSVRIWTSRLPGKTISARSLAPSWPGLCLLILLVLPTSNTQLGTSPESQAQAPAPSCLLLALLPLEFSSLLHKILFSLAHSLLSSTHCSSSLERRPLQYQRSSTNTDQPWATDCAARMASGSPEASFQSLRSTSTTSGSAPERRLPTKRACAASSIRSSRAWRYSARALATATESCKCSARARGATGRMQVSTPKPVAHDQFANLSHSVVRRLHRLADQDRKRRDVAPSGRSAVHGGVRPQGASASGSARRYDQHLRLWVQLRRRRGT